MNTGYVKSAAFLGLGLLLAVSGCTRSTNLNQGGLTPTRSAAPLQPAPLSPVNGGALDPVSPTPPPAGTTAQNTPNTVPVPENPGAATPEKPTVVASKPPESSQPVTRQALVGAWTVSTGGSNCQIFLALTKWSGGYRAASRRCSAAAISDVQAWDVKDKKVVLINSSGGTAATLYRSGAERFDGSTQGGGAISFSR